MANYPPSVEHMIELISKFPGIGRRSAERIAYYILKASRQEMTQLTESITKVKNTVGFCRACNNFSEGEFCNICSSGSRKRTLLCIVEDPKDVAAMEGSGSYQGLYYVLLGAIAPLEGTGPQDLRIQGLLTRIQTEKVTEAIIATDADTEGEMTAIYLTRLLKPLGVTVTRIGLGLPVGSNLEYADPATLSKALESRRAI